MAIFNLYNELVNSCAWEDAQAELDRIQQYELDEYPVRLFDKADVQGLVEGLGARVCVHAACGHKEVHDGLPYVWQFLFVAKCNGHFIVHVKVNYKCQSCIMQDFRRRMAPAFNELVWTHGLSAYSRTHTVREAVERLHNTLTHNEWEICVTESDAHVGPYGLYLKGSLTGLFDGDVWSTVNEEGQRISDQADNYDFVGDSVEKYLDRKADEDHRYFEGFLCQYECAGVWMTREASRKYNDLSAAMRAEARRLGVPFTLV